MIVYIDATGTSDKKKDAERECAIDACRKLDAAGILKTDLGGLAGFSFFLCFQIQF